MTYRKIKLEDGSTVVIDNEGRVVSRGPDTEQTYFNPLYQGAGLFECGMDTNLLNASVSLPGSVLSWIPWTGNNEKRYGGGIMASFGEENQEFSNPEENCADCQTPNHSTYCEFYWGFGRYCQGLPTIDALNTGMRSYEQFPTYRLYGNVTDPTGKIVAPQGTIVDNDEEWAFVRAGARLALWLAGEVWSGDGAGTAQYPRIWGLQHQINTGWQDFSGISCSVVDPNVVVFDNYVGDMYNGYSLCEIIEAVVRMARYRAEVSGNPILGDPTIWTTPNVARAVMKDWTCCKTGTVCDVAGGQTAGGVQLVMDAFDAQNQAKKLSQDGRYVVGVLNIDGMNVTLRGDPYMPHTVNGNVETADLYFIPRTMGGMPVIQGHYQDFRGVDQSRYVKLGAHIAVTDNGRYLTTFEHANNCINGNVTIKPRVMVRVPWVTARITGVSARLYQRFPYPGELPGGKNTPGNLEIEPWGTGS